MKKSLFGIIALGCIVLSVGCAATVFRMVCEAGIPSGKEGIVKAAMFLGLALSAGGFGCSWYGARTDQSKVLAWIVLIPSLLLTVALLIGAAGLL